MKRALVLLWDEIEFLVFCEGIQLLGFGRAKVILPRRLEGAGVGSSAGFEQEVLRFSAD